MEQFILHEKLSTRGRMAVKNLNNNIIFNIQRIMKPKLDQMKEDKHWEGGKVVRN